MGCDAYSPYKCTSPSPALDIPCTTRKSQGCRHACGESALLCLHSALYSEYSRAGLLGIDKSLRVTLLPDTFCRNVTANKTLHSRTNGVLRGTTRIL